MRYAFLDLLACQACHAELGCFTYRERAAEIPGGPFEGGTRVGLGQGVAPLPASAQSGDLLNRLRAFAQPAAEPSRNFAVEIDEGILICPGCARWYPITQRLPEILPDHLRDFDADAARMREAAAAMPPQLADAVLKFRPSSHGADKGARYKRAEMSIQDKIDDPEFFGPGYSSPYNPWNPEFTLYLISLFGSVLRLLDLKKGERVLDSGVGYAWTTEWFHRSGVPAVGVDISRTYLEVGIERMGDSRPHLVIGDVESLPFKSGVFDAVLAYESFHHIFDRRRAMAGYDRVLSAAGRVVLAEPGGKHERADVSVKVMKKYGILERGMELADVMRYAADSGFTRIDQVYLMHGTQHDIGHPLDKAYIKERCPVEGNLFRLRKPERPGEKPPRLGRWASAKHAIKRRLLGVGLD
jgi:ubiquinone/menaquinone biosynthesis C-methylase UbiE/uncharacterized protein YbaR (Trm112 family)